MLKLIRKIKNFKNHLEGVDQGSHYYNYDLWEDIKDRVKEHIPKGFTLYGEALGYTKTGAMIQEGYDYGCEKGELKLEVYKITQTNDDGFVTVLSPDQVTQFCEKAGLTRSKVFYKGKAYWILPDIDVNVPNWTELFIEKLRADYNEKDCHMCVNAVPEEGVVLLVEDLFEYVAFKLKSFRFLEWETKSLDKGEVADIEDRVPEVLVTKEWTADEVDVTKANYIAGVDAYKDEEE